MGTGEEASMVLPESSDDYKSEVQECCAVKWIAPLTIFAYKGQVFQIGTSISADISNQNYSTRGIQSG